MRWPATLSLHRTPATVPVKAGACPPSPTGVTSSTVCAAHPVPPTQQVSEIMSGCATAIPSTYSMLRQDTISVCIAKIIIAPVLGFRQGMENESGISSSRNMAHISNITMITELLAISAPYSHTKSLNRLEYTGGLERCAHDCKYWE